MRCPLRSAATMVREARDAAAVVAEPDKAGFSGKGIGGPPADDARVQVVEEPQEERMRQAGMEKSSRWRSASVPVATIQVSGVVYVP